MELCGTIPPMVTPVRDRSGSIAVDALRELTESLVEGGVHGLFPCGTTGEFANLSRKAREQVIQTVAAGAGSLPVLAGCGGTSRAEVTELIKDAKAAGADAAVVVTPYYSQGTQPGLVEFYTDIADASQLPILVYHIPQVTGQELTVETVAELAAHPSIIGIKDSSGGSQYIYEVVQATPDDFAVLCGDVINAQTVLSMGADGIVPGQANYLPSTLAEVYDAYVAGNRERSAQAIHRVCETSRPFDDIPIVPAIKYLTTCVGHDVGPPLPPFGILGDDSKTRLRTHFETIQQS